MFRHICPFALFIGLALVLPGQSLSKTRSATASKLTFRGVGHLSRQVPAEEAVGNEIRTGPEADREFEKFITGSVSSARARAAHVPTVAASPFSFSAGNGFDGLTHLEQRMASGGRNFSLEPPDQGLAVGQGFLLEAVNTAIRVRDTSGNELTAPTSLNEFFRLDPAIIRSPAVVFGPFATDPKCYFDTDTMRWFVTMLVIDVAPATGAFLPQSWVYIAVSQTPDPTGDWNIFSIDTTNNTGAPEHPNCPCFGDQPLIGADANGFYVSTNEFPLFASGFNGAQVYAISKAKLTANPPPAAFPVVSFDGLPLAEGPAYSLQPATTPPGGSHASQQGGIEYFLSALDFDGTLDNRIAVWALTNTSSLNSASPSLTLHSKVIDSQVYGQPPDAEQQDGPLPLADLIFSGEFGRASRQHLPLIASNDDRMQQAVFANGLLWSALNTVVKTETGPVRTGAAYFGVQPFWTGGALGASVARQGYISLSGRSVLFPAVGLNKDGKGVIAFSVVGAGIFPSVGYAPVDAVNGAGQVRIVRQGSAPADGFSGYPFFGGRTERWGDYSAAVSDQTGNIWFAVEYIPNLPRTSLANWGTFIGHVAP